MKITKNTYNTFVLEQKMQFNSKGCVFIRKMDQVIMNNSVDKKLQ